MSGGLAQGRCSGGAVYRSSEVTGRTGVSGTVLDSRNRARGGSTRGGVMTAQIVAVVATWLLSIIATFIILKIVDALVGLRVTPQEETVGLDVSQHEEEGYIFV